MNAIRKRVIIGTVVVAAIGLASVLNGLFNGFGAGGDGTTIGVPSVEDPPSQKADSEQSEPRHAPINGVLEVVIDGEKYSVRDADKAEIDKLRPIALSQLIDLAKEAKGNDEGIRVRIFRRESSLPTAERALEEALLKAGLTKASVSWKIGLLP